MQLRKVLLTALARTVCALALGGSTFLAAAQVQLTEAQRQELRRQADANRERNAREREELQRGFRTAEPPATPGAAAASAQAPAPPAKFDSKAPCAIDDFDKRVALYAQSRPQARAMLQDILQQGRLSVGMPLDMFRMLTCESIKDVNTTRTQAAEHIQYVMSERNPFLAKYVYVRNGTVYAIQQ